MAGMTDRTLAGKVMDFLLAAGAALTQPTQPLHLRLYTAAGSETASGTEATGTNCPGYTAGGASMGATAFGANSAGVSSNSNAISWTATGTWANIVAVEIWDTAATPVRLLWGTTSTISVANGDTLTFAAAAITADASAW